MNSRWTMPAHKLVDIIDLSRPTRPEAKGRREELSSHDAGMEPAISQNAELAPHMEKRSLRSAWSAQSGNLGDLVVIDLRPDAEACGSPIAQTPLVAPSTHELMEALEQLPSGCNPVLCVVRSDCIFLLDRKSCMRVSGSRTVLEKVRTRLEAA
jgi:hypothetical protein